MKRELEVVGVAEPEGGLELALLFLGVPEGSAGVDDIVLF